MSGAELPPLFSFFPLVFSFFAFWSPPFHPTKPASFLFDKRRGTLLCGRYKLELLPSWRGGASPGRRKTEYDFFFFPLLFCGAMEIEDGGHFFLRHIADGPSPPLFFPFFLLFFFTRHLVRRRANALSLSSWMGGPNRLFFPPLPPLCGWLVKPVKNEVPSLLDWASPVSLFPPSDRISSDLSLLFFSS